MEAKKERKSCETKTLKAVPDQLEIEVSMLKRSLQNKENHIKELESDLHKSSLATFALREEIKRLVKLLSKHGVSADSTRMTNLLEMNGSESTRSQESPDKSARIEELEQMVSELTQEREILKGQMAGYKSFKLPIKI